MWLGSVSTALGLGGDWEPEPTDSACPRCGRSVGPGEVSPDDDRCPGCRPEKLRWERLIRLGTFEGDLRRAVLETKYARWPRQGELLGEMLGRRLAPMLEQESIDPDRVALVPTPMPWLRRMRRGIDHASTIARGVHRVTGCRVERLLRRRSGPTQAAVPASARVANIRRQILLSRRTPENIDLLILIDDVRTTGATLDACCRAVRGEFGRSGGARSVRGRVGVGGPDAGAGEVRIWAAVAATAQERGRRAADGS
ncbi:MAG: hypothetical protein AAFR96_00730 [Planctomycetota bacterium]